VPPRGVPSAALLAGLLLAAAGFTGCSPGKAPAGSTGSASSASPPLAAGRGPQPRYTVHEAPAPGTCHYRYVQGKPLPDPACTPGALNPEVTPSTLRETICASGYSARVRPARNVTDREKRLSARAYGYTGSFATAELDHLVPLGVGGDPNDTRNLWLEPNDDARATTNANGKDDVENTLHSAVCAGRVGLVEAQRAIAENWTTALSVLGLE
jgi:hypothetical protein